MLRRSTLLRAWLAGVAGIPGLCAVAAPEKAGSESKPPALGVRRRPLRFPADFGAHPDTRTEWWYVTGWLAEPGRGEDARLGFQVTFFRSRTDVAADHPSRFAATQLVFAHAAVSDVAGRRLHHDQRVARAGFGIAEALPGDTAVRLRDWRFDRSGPAERSRYRARVTSEAGFGLDLVLDTTQPVLLQGDAGHSRKGPLEHQASHYYSQPQLAASGRVRLDGRERSVEGRAWLDHEWSETLLAPEAVGWDWLGINLRDGGALTAFRLRRADGSALWAGGSHRPKDGSTVSFGPRDVVLTPGRRWSSPHSGAAYPVAWTLDTPLGRQTLEAVFDAQELDSRRSTGAVYWEGLSVLRDAGGQVVGDGYLEMTGYAGRLRL
jgi:predicted secreted hydrolase